MPVSDELLSTPFIASVQSSPGSAVEDPETLWRLAQASLSVQVNGQSLRLLRLQGIPNIRVIREGLRRAGRSDVATIGLLKVDYPDSPIYITPTELEVYALIELGCEVIALDGTPRPRPGGESLKNLIEIIHEAGRIAMADCDCIESVRYALECGADWVGTTLAGYTEARGATQGPDFDLLREAVCLAPIVIAEGRFTQPWDVESALRIGAKAVVVGGALNDPVKQTKALWPKSSGQGSVGVVDIGGTWIRFAVASEGVDRVELRDVVKEPLPQTADARMAWIRERVAESGVSRIAVGTGGTVDPRTGEVWEAKPIIPGHQGSIFNADTTGVPCLALNDGLATAWGHACHPNFAGNRVLTLALGTGVGAGYVHEGRIVAGRRGEYPRLNDLVLAGGGTIEDALGGASLADDLEVDDHGNKVPRPAARELAIEAFRLAHRTAVELYYPDVVVVGGSVGLSNWMRPELERVGAVPSPYGEEAGMIGAACLALYRPHFL